VKIQANVATVGKFRLKVIGRGQEKRSENFRLLSMTNEAAPPI